MLSLGFRVLSKLLGLPLSLLKKFLADERVAPSLMETRMGTIPELPQDVLMDIFAKLEIPDLVRAASVCSWWRSAYTSLRDLGKYEKSQTPCLLYTSESAGQNVACLYSLAEQRVYKLNLPDPPIRSRATIGSSNGWLITADERSELHLLNPMTGEQIALPSVTTIEHIKPLTDGSGIIRSYQLSYHDEEDVSAPPSLHTLSDMRDELYYKAFAFLDPSTGRFIVVLIHNPYCQISFARTGDDKWTWLPFTSPYSDCMYIDGLLYAVTSFGQIHAFDLAASPVTMTIIIDKLQQHIMKNTYIFQAPWGDLLQIRRTVDIPEQVYENADTPMPCTLKIKVYKVDLEAKKHVEITSLPSHMLFLGFNNSLCLSAEEHPQLKENHVYFTDDEDDVIKAFKNDPHFTRDIGVLNLETGKRPEIVSQIWSNQPCPVWITPNFTTMNLTLGK